MWNATVLLRNVEHFKMLEKKKFPNISKKYCHNESIAHVQRMIVIRILERVTIYTQTDKRDTEHTRNWQILVSQLYVQQS
jgi:hypothetical protein